MRGLITFLIVLVLSVVLGTELAKHPGYALFTYRQWVVQMPLWFAFMSLIVTFFVLHLLVQVVHFITHLDERISNWFYRLRRHRAYDRTQRGLLEMMEEKWSSAEKHLIGGIVKTKNPIVNYLAAAEVAHAQKAYDRANTYLSKAYAAAPQDEVLIGLVQARLQLDQGLLEQALATLLRLRQLAPYHVGVLRLLEKMYVRLGEWQNLLDLVPYLRKAKALSGEQAQIFEKNIYCEILEAAVRKNFSIHQVRELWQSMPKKLRLHPDVLARYGQVLKTDKVSAAEIEPILRKILNKNWHDDLGLLYGSLHTTDPLRQLSQAEAWSKLYGKRNFLLLTLGRLSLRSQLWGKARQYFEEALQFETNTQTQLELAKLYEHLGETNLAMQHYKQGLQLTGIS